MAGERQGMVELYPGQLPYSLEAEQSVLGAVLIDPGCLTVVLDYLKPESFYRPQHRELFSLFVRMFTSSQVIDFITVLEAAQREEIFETEEDAKVYLTQLVQVVPSTGNVASYAKIVQEKYYIRSLIAAAQEIIDNASDGQADAGALIDAAEQRIFEIRQGRDSTGLIPVSEIILETYDRLQKLSGDDKNRYMGIPTGFNDLTRILTGLNRSDLILVAARPGMGKTAFALNIASHVAIKENRTVAIFSLEMGREQLVQRLLSSEALIPGTQLRTGSLNNEEWVKLAMSAQILSKAPILIDDTAGINVAEMKAKLRRVKDLGLVIIDYLQLMTSARRTDNRVQEVSEITRSLKIMAKDLNVPVITLSQLSRGPESRSDHRPMLSDLRESGSIEQDADIVLFLYRDEYYNPDSEAHGTAECIVAKNRHGDLDKVTLGWDGQFTRYRGLELYHDDPKG